MVVFKTRRKRLQWCVSPPPRRPHHKIILTTRDGSRSDAILIWTLRIQQVPDNLAWIIVRLRRKFVQSMGL